MMNFKTYFCSLSKKINKIAINKNRNYSNYYDVLQSLDKRDKSARVQSSVSFYLKRIRTYDNLIENEKKEFEKGRKYLAQIMGRDPENFTQDDIDEAIKYLLPSALFSKKARPYMKPPEDVFPPRKEVQCDSSGRPLHDMFYTRYPHYYRLMNDIVYQLEQLKLKEDTLPSDVKSKEIEPLELLSSYWVKKDDLQKIIDERISDVQYDNWVLLIDRLSKHPLSGLCKEFIYRFRHNFQSVQTIEDFPEPVVDPDDDRKYIIAYGQKKHSFAKAKVIMPGTGSFSVNESRLLQVFADLGNREQIMYPLLLTNTLGKVDIIAHINGFGISSSANALRLAIARSLASLLPVEEGKNKLHVAGLLTQDHRFAEKKQPGSKKSRKKPIWKAR